jgi:hypothetical protein
LLGGLFFPLEVFLVLDVDPVHSVELISRDEVSFVDELIDDLLLNLLVLSVDVLHDAIDGGGVPQLF